MKIFFKTTIILYESTNKKLRTFFHFLKDLCFVNRSGKIKNKTKTKQIPSERARDIMGHNYMNVEFTLDVLGIKIPRWNRNKIINKFEEIPYTEECMIFCSRDYILFPYFPSTIQSLLKRLPPKIRSPYDENVNKHGDKNVFKYLYDIHPCDKMGWRMIRISPFLDSENKDWCYQESIATSESNYVPSAHVVVYGMVLNLLSQGTRMFRKGFVRTSTVYNSGQVSVGMFTYDMLLFMNYIDTQTSPLLGVSEAKWPDKLEQILV